jgi:sodium/potassium-transporting ATPase subunit alpha
MIGYDPTDKAFIELTKAIVLGTYTIFSYDPEENECKQLIARMKGVPVSDYEDKDLPEAEMKDARARLIAAEKDMMYIHRHCKGDASETGLVQFGQAVMDLVETREKYPTYKYMKDGKEIECLIPFSSDIKFNLFIRDMAPEIKNPTNIDENLCVYMKGAPERILSRCSKILIKGEEVDFSDELRKEVNAANSSFGKLGERVLAFARYRLPHDKYTKGSY